MRDKTKFGEKTNPESAIIEYRKFIIFAEGQVTEMDYFNGVNGHKKELNIPAIIQIEPKKRPVEKAQWSNINKIIDYIEEKKAEYTADGIDFLKEHDQLWIVFDKDAITEEQYKNALNYAEENDYKIGFTNSCFEVWLLLHFDDFHKYSEEQLTVSKANKDFIVNEVIIKSRIGLYGKNKKKVNFPCFKNGIKRACDQSLILSNDLDELYDKVGTTVNFLLKELLA